MKSTSKSAKSPAPATKPVAAKPAAKKKVIPVIAPAPAPSPVARVAPTPAPVAPPAVKAVASTPVVTTIAARIDVGFGNALYIRGEGPGLSWNQGIAMECVADELWRIALADATEDCVFKFLVNDLTWCVGPDYTVARGSSVILTPEF